ncbi:MAG: DUF4203 domain-containing protein, partial [Anaerolineaceae bacterium]|nr:DUF4203 domain-containing protein [Anaerolineaceae bacterium]
MLYFTAALVFVGLIVCVSGRTLFATTPFLGGFLVSGMLGYQLGLMFIAPPNNWPAFLLPLLSFIAVGLIGGVLAKALYTVLLVIAGLALGAFIGLVAGYVINLGGNPHVLTSNFFSFQPENLVQLYTMLIAAALFAGLSLVAQDTMAMLSTAFFGAGIAAINLADLFDATMTGRVAAIATEPVLVIFAWLF